MNRPVFVLSIFIITTLSAYGGFRLFLYLDDEPDQVLTPGQSQLPTQSVQPEKKFIGITRPNFELPDVTGKIRSVSEWDSKVLVINFWATWCPPCREEMPEFIALQDTYQEQGLQFIGIALQKAEDVTDFINELGVNYPILVGEEAVIEVSRAYGNQIGALPYTVIVNRQSKIAFIKRGPLSRDKAEQIITSLL